MSDMPSVYGCDCRKARKTHECCECHGTIEIGEPYHKHHGIWSGKASTFKVCTDCEALRAECDKGERDPEFCTPFRCLYDSVFNLDDAALIKRFLDTKRKRRAAIMPWMLERESEALLKAAAPPIPQSSVHPSESDAPPLPRATVHDSPGHHDDTSGNSPTP